MNMGTQYLTPNGAPKSTRVYSLMLPAVQTPSFRTSGLKLLSSSENSAADDAENSRSCQLT
jgi:hypothetical protein